MHDFLLDLSRQRRYWALLVLLGIALEAVALYYQYALDEWPCVLCIHIRIAVMGFILVGLVGLFSVDSMPLQRLLHGLNTLVMAWFVERSYQVLAVERGWTFGDCDLELGMPSWLAFDRWLPPLFEVKTSCGYTPYILFNISMAESLLAISVILLILSAVLFVYSWLD